MSYSQYRELLRRMTADELNAEVAKLQKALDKATVRRTRNAYSQMLTAARAQQAENFDRALKRT